MTEKKYNINGKTYFQSKLVPGQIQQLCGVMNYVTASRFTGMKGPGDIIIALGSKLLAVMAILLTPEGVEVKKKDLVKIEDEFFDADVDVVEVMADFFLLNRTDSVFEKLTGIISTIAGKVEDVKKPARSTKPKK